MTHGPRNSFIVATLTTAFALLHALGPAAIADAECVDVTDHFQWVSAIETSAIEFVLRGDHLYVPDGPGLRVLDVSNPASPVDVASAATPQPLGGLDISGDYAAGYWTVPGPEPEVVAIFDVSDPLDPRLVGTALFEQNVNTLVPRDIAIDGDVVYVADNAQFYTVDVSDPASPEILAAAFVAPEEVNGVAYHGDHVYLTDSFYRGLTVFDVSDPANPIDTDFPSLGGARYPFVTAGFLFLDVNGTIRIYDLTDPGAPNQVHSFEPTDSGEMSGNGDRLYISGSTQVAVYDVSSVTDPVFIGSYGHHLAGEVQVAFPYAFTPGFPQASVYDVSDLTTPLGVGALQLPDHSVIEVATDGEFAFVIGRDGVDDQLVAVDVSNPAAPFEIERIPLTRIATGIALEDGYVFVSSKTPSTLTTVDVSEPGSPAAVSAYELPSTSPVDAIDVDAGIAALATWTGLTVVDVSDPLFPMVVSTLKTAGRLRHVYLDDGLAYLTGFDDGLLIVDLTLPQFPTLLGTLDLPNSLPESITIDGSTAYVATRRSGLLVVDVGDPSAPSLTGQSLTMTAATDVEVVWPLAYVGHEIDATGVQVLDVSDPTRIVALGSLGVEGRPIASTIVGGLLYSAAGKLEISGLHCATTSAPVASGGPIRALRLLGNPSRDTISLGWNLVGPVKATLRIYDSSGRRVRQLFAGRTIDPQGSHNWDGQSEDGTPVPSGSYIAQLRTENETTSRRIVIVR